MFEILVKYTLFLLIVGGVIGAFQGIKEANQEHRKKYPKEEKAKPVKCEQPLPPPQVIPTEREAFERNINDKISSAIKDSSLSKKERQELLISLDNSLKLQKKSNHMYDKQYSR